MPVFEYSALNQRGKTVSGILDAESPAAARQKLRLEGKFPVSVDLVRDALQFKADGRLHLAAVLQRVRPAEVAMATRQLATLVDAGFSLVGALETVSVQTATQRLRKILAKVKDAIVEGQSFAESLQPYSRVFSPLYINMVRAGESSGTLNIVLERLADVMEKQEALKSRITAALAYPILMLLVGATVLLVLMTYIVPRITAIFEDMNQALPAPTQFLIAVSGFLRDWWWLLLIALAGGVLAVWRIRRLHRGRLFTDQLLLKSPLLGGLLQKIDTARLTRTLASLLENGVPLIASLRIVQNIPANILFREALEAAGQSVSRGIDLAESLAPADVIPPLALQMIRIGEQTGALENMMLKVARAYENEVELSIMTVTSLLEPLMIVAMGGVIGFIVLSICLPIFEMNQLVS